MPDLTGWGLAGGDRFAMAKPPPKLHRCNFKTHAVRQAPARPERLECRANPPEGGSSRRRDRARFRLGRHNGVSRLSDRMLSRRLGLEITFAPNSGAARALASHSIWPLAVRCSRWRRDAHPPVRGSPQACFGEADAGEARVARPRGKRGRGRNCTGAIRLRGDRDGRRRLGRSRSRTSSASRRSGRPDGHPSGPDRPGR